MAEFINDYGKLVQVIRINIRIHEKYSIKLLLHTLVQIQVLCLYFHAILKIPIG